MGKTNTIMQGVKGPNMNDVKLRKSPKYTLSIEKYINRITMKIKNDNNWTRGF